MLRRTERLCLLAALLLMLAVTVLNLSGSRAPAPLLSASEEGAPVMLCGVDLNTADEEALQALYGVGPALAAAISEYRQENGPFRSPEELLNVPGFGEAKLEALLAP